MAPPLKRRVTRCEVDYPVELLAKTLENHLGSLTLPDLTAKLKRRQLADPDLKRRIALNHSPEKTEIYLHLLTTFDLPRMFSRRSFSSVCVARKRLAASSVLPMWSRMC